MSLPADSAGAPLGDDAIASHPKLSGRKLPLPIPLIHALILCLAAEMFNQKSPGLVWQWGLSSPHLLALNVLVYLSITWLCILLTNRIAVGCVLSSLVLLFPVISSFKRAVLLVPLLPSDLKLVTQMSYLMGKYGSILAYIPVLLGALGLLVAVGYAVHRVIGMRFALPIRALGTVSSLGILSVACYQPPQASSDPVEQLISTSSSDLVETYQKQGFAVAFGSLTEQAVILDPAYTRKAVNQAVAELRPEEITCEPDVKPDIIAILSESMWDPTQLPGVQFSQDPLPNLRRLQNEGVGLQFLSPTFGGGTANIEFELLTGFTTGLMPEGSYPFVEPVMYSPQPSIARFLAQWATGPSGSTTIRRHSGNGRGSIRTSASRSSSRPRISTTPSTAANTSRMPRSANA